MGQAKYKLELQESAQHDSAQRDGRRCPYCSAVVPYGTDLGPNEECPACVGALKED